jgi:hypothetical protein
MRVTCPAQIIVLDLITRTIVDKDTERQQIPFVSNFSHSNQIPEAIYSAAPNRTVCLHLPLISVARKQALLL